MQDRPTSVELLEAAADFVDRELVPTIEGARQFQARVVANVMRIVAREIKMEDPLVRSEVKALARLLGHDAPHLHSLDDLRTAAAGMGEELRRRGGRRRLARRSTCGGASERRGQTAYHESALPRERYRYSQREEGDLTNARAQSGTT